MVQSLLVSQKEDTPLPEHEVLGKGRAFTLKELRQIIKEHSTGYKPPSNPVSEAVERFNENYTARNGRRLKTRF